MAPHLAYCPVMIFSTSFSKTPFITSKVAGNPFSAISALALLQRVSSLESSPFLVETLRDS